MSIAGEPVETMVDTGLSTTILSFELFKQIGQKANIPISAPSPPDVILWDYNQCAIPVGAKVDLELFFNGKSVIAPVYMQGTGSAESAACLLGTNVVVTLGMMSPACGGERRGGIKAAVCLVRGQQIPSQKGAMVEAQIEGSVPGSAVLFKPRNDLSQSLGIELKDSIMCPNDESKVLIPIRNAITNSLQVLPGELIGSVDIFELEKDTCLMAFPLILGKIVLSLPELITIWIINGGTI